MKTSQTVAPVPDGNLATCSDCADWTRAEPKLRRAGTAPGPHTRPVKPRRLPADARIVLIHPAAPPKPALGQACNGCGICCAHEPCPLGMLLSRRTRGPCAALQWDEAAQRYLCGALSDPPSWLPWARRLPGAAVQAMVRRWIGAARGCDAALQAVPAVAADRATGSAGSE